MGLFSASRQRAHIVCFARVLCSCASSEMSSRAKGVSSSSALTLEYHDPYFPSACCRLSCQPCPIVLFRFSSVRTRRTATIRG